MRFSTRAVHTGQDPEPGYGATIVPIYPTSVFTYDSPGVNKGYDYARHGNPTRTAFEECMASLEGGAHAVAFASGMAAIDASLRMLRPGDRVVFAEDLYGGTYALATKLLEPMGVEIAFRRLLSSDDLRAAWRPGTRLAWAETPANPIMRIADLAGLAAVAHEYGALLAVDSTFASPYLQNPLALGADLVMHSSTKYIGGHSDLLGGLVVTNDSAIHQHLVTVSRLGGATPSPFDCWLALRGAKTLSLRMREHCANAAELARRLEARSDVECVHYPGLRSHPDHELAARQMAGFGGMLAFDLGSGAEGAQRAREVMSRVRVCVLTGSLGGVETILSHPWTMSHAPLPEAERLARGVGPGLIRLSVGIEDVDDLYEDLDQALAPG